MVIGHWFNVQTVSQVCILTDCCIDSRRCCKVGSSARTSGREHSFVGGVVSDNCQQDDERHRPQDHHASTHQWCEM